MSKKQFRDLASLVVLSAFLILIWSPLFIFGGAA